MIGKIFGFLNPSCNSVRSFETISGPAQSPRDSLYAPECLRCSFVIDPKWKVREVCWAVHLIAVEDAWDLASESIAVHSSREPPLSPHSALPGELKRALVLPLSRCCLRPGYTHLTARGRTFWWLLPTSRFLPSDRSLPRLLWSGPRIYAAPWWRRSPERRGAVSFVIAHRSV